MPEVTLKKGDTTPELTVELGGQNVADPAQEIDENASVRFYMAAQAGQGQDRTEGDLLINAPADRVGYSDDPPTATYDFRPGDTSRTGQHLAEVVVTYSDGEVQSFPAGDQFYTVTIAEPTNRETPLEELDPPDITVGVVDADEVNARTLQAVERISGAVTSGKELTDLEGANLKLDDQGRLNSQVEGTSASHTNPTYDSDEDGTIDADVDNQNTTSEVADFGSLSVSDVLDSPSVPTVGDLPDPTALSAGTSIYVESESRYYKVKP